MIYEFLAEGFEEIEALCPLDILRRAGIEISAVSVNDNLFVTGAHGITFKADKTARDISFDKLCGIILPGGMPGTLNLEKSEIVNKLTDSCAEKGLLIAAICAAPSIIGKKGLLKDKKATCFTGFEKYLIGAKTVDTPVVRDGNIITARGAGAAFDFAYEIVSFINNGKTADKLSADMKYPLRG